MMVGRSVSFTVEKGPAHPKEVILSVDHLVVQDVRGLNAINDLSFQVRQGEILGIAGVDGNGQSELIQAITGLRNVEEGSVKINGKDVTNRTPRKRSEERRVGKEVKIEKWQ